MLYACIFHIYSLVPIDTLARILKTFLICIYACQAIFDTNEEMSEYSLIGNDSVVRCRTLIKYDIID